MKYDVYSFGVLLLQIISGKRNTCLHGLNGNLNLLEYVNCFTYHLFDCWIEIFSLFYVSFFFFLFTHNEDAGNGWNLHYFQAFELWIEGQGMQFIESST